MVRLKCRDEKIDIIDSLFFFYFAEKLVSITTILYHGMTQDVCIVQMTLTILGLPG